jgi:drug/metabolite transporter (DMT)-like permease
MQTTVLARLQLLAAAFLFSTGGVAIKSCQLSDWQIAGFRCGVAAAAMWLLLPAARRRWTWRVLLVGAAYAATLTLYALANKATTAANAVLLQSTAPLYLVLLAPALLGERVRGRDLLLMAAMAAGLVVLLSGDVAATVTAPAPGRGNLLGALAGGCWALTLLGLRWLERSSPRDTRGHAAAAVVAGNLLAFLAALPMALPVVDSRPADWEWVLYLGVFQIAVAYMLLTAAMRSVPAFDAALLLLVEPVFNPVWAWWIHGEVAGPATLLGGAVILAVTAAKTWLDSRRPWLDPRAP